MSTEWIGKLISKLYYYLWIDLSYSMWNYSLLLYNFDHGLNVQSQQNVQSIRDVLYKNMISG